MTQGHYKVTKTAKPIRGDSKFVRKCCEVRSVFPFRIKQNQITFRSGDTLRACKREKKKNLKSLGLFTHISGKIVFVKT